MRMLSKHRGTRTPAVLLVSAFLLAAGVLLPVRAEDKPAKGGAEPDKLAKAMVGTWVLVGRPGQVGVVPAAGGLKFFTGKHWCVTQADAGTGKVTRHHGGTYALEGDAYTETVEYASENSAGLLKKVFKFKIKLEDDTLTQVGVGDDNPYNEVWKRAK